MAGSRIPASGHRAATREKHLQSAFVSRPITFAIPRRKRGLSSNGHPDDDARTKARVTRVVSRLESVERLDPQPLGLIPPPPRTPPEQKPGGPASLAGSSRWSGLPPSRWFEFRPHTGEAIGFLNPWHV